MTKPMDCMCPNCGKIPGVGCYDTVRREWYPTGIYHAERLERANPAARSLSLFPEEMTGGYDR